jgi:hypothetical protein
MSLHQLLTAGKAATAIMDARCAAEHTLSDVRFSVSEQDCHHAEIKRQTGILGGTETPIVNIGLYSRFIRQLNRRMFKL